MLCEIAPSSQESAFSWTEVVGEVLANLARSVYLKNLRQGHQQQMFSSRRRKQEKCRHGEDLRSRYQISTGKENFRINHHAKQNSIDLRDIYIDIT